MYKRIIASVLLLLALNVGHAQQKRSFNQGWEFVKDIDTVFSGKLLLKNTQIPWQTVSLPHTANIEPIQKQAQQWQGICFYRKFFSVPASWKGKHIAIRFDAAMQDADLYLNGQHIFKHLGGYLPFYIDLSDQVKFGAVNTILVKLDNRDNPLIPPGKPLKDLDFNYYSGIYRDTWLMVTDPLHISDPVAAGKTAGGGLFIHYEEVTDSKTTMVVQTDVQNDGNAAKKAAIRLTLRDKAGKIVATSLSPNKTIDKKGSDAFTQKMSIATPILWSPDNPHLYQLSVELLNNGKVIGSETCKTGIKTIRFEGGAFYLNGKKLIVHGTNRHQDYPYAGNAISNNAQYRDAWKIKEAGFNFVRSSHYPQSPAYLDACDELGIMVMDAIPGWQFAGNDSFQVNSFQDTRDMIRRDRNHASIILWEASLNESGMKENYMRKAHAIVHEELPFEDTYSAGWINSVYDVFLPARQHAKAPDYWKKYNKPRPFIIAEYGDWEYYAQNAGFNQTAYKDLQPEERSSRQLRGFGEKRLLQQALNYQESHNDNLYAPAAGDANWLMFDYNRGYAADIESSGIMDMLRLPKFSFYFYQSQINPALANPSPFNKPMLYIANYWRQQQDTVVRIFSNCEQVELFLNGQSMGRQYPDKDANSTNLAHPPFTFRLKQFQPGLLTAVGSIQSKEVVRQQRRTPGQPAAIQVRADISGKPLQAGCNDMVFVYAEIQDKEGTMIPDANATVEFTIKGDATIIGPTAVQTEAGIAGILLQAGTKGGTIVVTAQVKGLAKTTFTIKAL
jgi:beta-galactosidase